MRGIVESHGGSGRSSSVTPVMAVFGVAISHEDDALRACRAAVEMRGALPELGIAGRTGINTGEVVTGTAERLATAAESLDRVLGRLDAQQQALNAKVDQIVASVDTESGDESGDEETTRQLQQQVAELEKSNADLKAQASRMARKTLPPMVSAILAKSGTDTSGEKIDTGVLDKTLQSLSVEQRIAVKAELARAGMIE
jgi:predicted RNase H-like nuclease (RuvC/YqgF family)